MEPLSLTDLEAMTLAEGEGWGLSHVLRVLYLAGLIGVDLTFDQHTFDIAAYLHDWGAFPRYRQQGVDHALRSRLVAEEQIIPRMDLTAEQVTLILDAIERHDYRDQREVTTSEALLLREADFLDFLGVIGFAREFAWGPNNLVTCYQRILSRRDSLHNRFTLPRAQILASVQLERLAQCLVWLEEESFGHM
jgi:HD superfamily phosphodiesterase